MLAAGYFHQYGWEYFLIIYLWCPCFLGASPVRKAETVKGG
jgi:hypothetical protein